jgi:hypothetical protein
VTKDFHLQLVRRHVNHVRRAASILTQVERASPAKQDNISHLLHKVFVIRAVFRGFRQAIIQFSAWIALKICTLSLKKPQTLHIAPVIVVTIV